MSKLFTMSLTKIKTKLRKKMKTTNKEELRFRVAKMRAAIMDAIKPNPYYMPIIVGYNKKLNNPQDKKRISAMMSGRLIDEKLLVILENVPNQIKGN